MIDAIGVAGGSGAGKSVIAHALRDRLGACVIDLDSYYIDRSALSPEERIQVNYDEPAAIDAALLVEHVERLRRGEPVPKPVYSFESHTRIAVELVTPARLVIVEGLFTLWWEELRALLDLKVFVDAPADLRLIRRLRRDLAERGRTVDQALRQYLGTVRPMHERYVEPCRDHADVVIVNDGPAERAVDDVLEAMKHPELT